MCKHTRKFPLPQNIKTELNKCVLDNNFTSFSGTKFARLQSALPCWFPIQYTEQKMFWYHLKSNYFILDCNCILLSTLIWCHTFSLFFLIHSCPLSEDFWHFNFPVQVHFFNISATNLWTYFHIMVLCWVQNLCSLHSWTLPLEAHM